jgi:hypothetical protein
MVPQLAHEPAYGHESRAPSGREGRAGEDLHPEMKSPRETGGI